MGGYRRNAWVAIAEIVTNIGKVFELSFSHICDDRESVKPFEDFYIADKLLTWGLLYEVGCANHQLEQGHDCDEIVLGQNIKIIEEFVQRLNERLNGSETLEWKVAFPSESQWVTAYKKLRFGVESEKRIYEYTTTVEPLYSTRDRALMQQRRALCCSGANRQFPYFDEKYEPQDFMFNVGIRLILLQNVQDNAEEKILNTIAKQIWKNKKDILTRIKKLF